METSPVSKKTRIAGWIMTILPALMLLFSASMKLIHPPSLDEGFQHLQIPISWALGLGILELGCTVIYLIPRTAVLGAILLTGYLGGAMIPHLLLGEPVFMHIILGVMLWGGIFLRDPRLRGLIPFVK